MKTYLYCKFEEKEKIKELGGKWDMDVKKWYVNEMKGELKDYVEVKIEVPYDEKDEYKALYSIRWCSESKSWVTSSKIAGVIKNDKNGF